MQTVTFSSASAETVWKNDKGSTVKTNSQFEVCMAYEVAKKVEQARAAVLPARREVATGSTVRCSNPVARS